MIENDLGKTRFRWVQGLIVVVALLLLGGLIYFQLYSGEVYARKAVYNRLRFLNIPATRGDIYDRNGNVMVNNKSGYAISITYSTEKEILKVVDNLVPLLLDAKLKEEFTAQLDRPALEEEPAVTDYNIFKQENVERIETELRDNILAILESQRYYRRYEPITIAPVSGKTLRQVDFSLVVAIEENRVDLPNVSVDIRPLRQYKYPNYAFHLLGSINEIDRSGNEGLEKIWDEVLSGEDGTKLVEVDVRGRPVNSMGEVEPVNGNDIYLTLDADLQKTVEDEFLRIMEEVKATNKARDRSLTERQLPNSGAVVVMEVDTGRILASASFPQIQRDNYAYYSSTEASKSEFIKRFSPLLNKVTSSRRPPGSIMKPFVALAALEEGLITPASSIYCNGKYNGLRNTWPARNTLHCWVKTGHGGPLNLRAGIKNSCNLYFYPLGERLGLEKIRKYYEMFGLNRYASVFNDIVRERELFTAYKGRPMPSDLAQLAIGQGALDVTPLQAVQMFAALANAELNDEGKYVAKLYHPYIVDKAISPTGEVIYQSKPTVMEEIVLEAEHLEQVRLGMYDVIQSYGGTGYWYFHEGGRPLYDFGIAGKTGTAQEVSWTNHGWFAAYAPFDDPEIAVVVLMEQGRSGSASTAPVLKAVLDAYFGIDREEGNQ